MARNQEVLDLPLGEWTLITNSNVTSLTFQIVTQNAYIRATAGTTAPDIDLAGMLYATGTGELQRPMSEMFTTPGMNRVWARPSGSQLARIFVDHS